MWGSGGRRRPTVLWWYGPQGRRAQRWHLYSCECSGNRVFGDCEPAVVSVLYNLLHSLCLRLIISPLRLSVAKSRATLAISVERSSPLRYIAHSQFWNVVVYFSCGSCSSFGLACLFSWDEVVDCVFSFSAGSSARANSSSATSAASSRSASPSICSNGLAIFSLRVRLNVFDGVLSCLGSGNGNLPVSGSSLIPRTPSKINPVRWVVLQFRWLRLVNLIQSLNFSRINSIKTPIGAHQSNKQSVLDKFKLFKPNEKRKPWRCTVSKQVESGD